MELELAMSRIRNYRLLKANDCCSWDSENLELKMAFVLKKACYYSSTWKMTLKVLAVVIITLILISIKMLNIFVVMGIHVPLNV